MLNLKTNIIRLKGILYINDRNKIIIKIKLITKIYIHFGKKWCRYKHPNFVSHCLTGCILDKIAWGRDGDPIFTNSDYQSTGMKYSPSGKIIILTCKCKQ